MTLPSYVHFTGPLLEYLAEQTALVRAHHDYEALATRSGLSEGARTARLSSGGQSVLQIRIVGLGMRATQARPPVQCRTCQLA